MVEDLEIAWSKILEATKSIAPQGGGGAEIWLKTCLPLGVEEDRLIIDVPNVFVREQIQTRFLKTLQEITSTLGIADKIELKVNSEVRDEEQKRARRASQPQTGVAVERLGLNQSYIFENFVVGKSNRLAHAASLAVAESPGVAYNPLFIWGGVGLGKTHLMHAIGHYIIKNNPSARVSYVSSEKFTNELITSIQNNRTQDFKAKYRSVDILLIDDIQFLANKESTQEEFFHTFNSLHDTKRQIVISSDRPPKEIQSVEERLVSRFEWGLVTDIQPPDYETRIAILRKKAELRELDIPDDVVVFIAQHIPSNIRELEGALNRVLACSRLNSELITVENASEWLKDIIQGTAKSPVTVEQIQEFMANEFNIPISDMRSAKRTAEIALCRQVAMYLTRELTDLSLQQIGQAFKKKDHTTVLHACRKVEKLMKEDQKIRGAVERARKTL